MPSAIFTSFGYRMTCDDVVNSIVDPFHAAVNDLPKNRLRLSYRGGQSRQASFSHPGSHALGPLASSSISPGH